MEHLLDKEMPVSYSDRMSLFRWFAAVLGVLLLFFTVWLLSKDDNKISDSDTIVSSQKIISYTHNEYPEEINPLAGSTEKDERNILLPEAGNVKDQVSAGSRQSEQRYVNTSQNRSERTPSVSEANFSSGKLSAESSGQKSDAPYSFSGQVSDSGTGDDRIDPYIPDGYPERSEIFDFVHILVEDLALLPMLSYAVKQEEPVLPKENGPADYMPVISGKKSGPYFSIGIDKELFRGGGLLYAGLDLMLGIPVSRHMTLVGGFGYKGDDLKRDYTFVNSLVISQNQSDLQYLTRSSVVYVEDVHHIYIRTGLELSKDRFSVGAYILPTVTMFDGGYNVDLVSGFDGEGFYKQGQIYSINYGLGINYQLWKKFSVGLNYFSNFKPLLEATPDQGKSYNYYNRLGANIFYRF